MYTHFLAIDWSARNHPSPKQPTKDAIWLAEAAANGPITTHYFRTRYACRDYVLKRLTSLKNERVLIGWDFSFGYPQGFAAALGLTGHPPWRAVWDHLTDLIEDGPDNRSNRFEVGSRLNAQIGAPAGPFWGVPAGRRHLHLHAKRTFTYPVACLPERRAVELLYPRMQPAWKLAYTGSVGSQALLGIPVLRYLRNHPSLKKSSRIWPFESAGGDAGATLVHAEIYPSLLPLPSTDTIRDRAQVKGYVTWLQTQQQAGTLPALLHRPWGNDPKVHQQVTKHEGWVLGMKADITTVAHQAR